jgi:hypothetical protein
MQTSLFISCTYPQVLGSPVQARHELAACGRVIALEKHICHAVDQVENLLMIPPKVEMQLTQRLTTTAIGYHMGVKLRSCICMYMRDRGMGETVKLRWTGSLASRKEQPIVASPFDCKTKQS